MNRAYTHNDRNTIIIPTLTCTYPNQNPLEYLRDVDVVTKLTQPTMKLYSYLFRFFAELVAITTFLVKSFFIEQRMSEI